MSYRNDIEFLIVYIREAHPNMLKEGNETGIVGRPRNLDERVILATECVSKYKLSAPMVIDGMDGQVNNAYKAAPVRVTVVDIDGKVSFYAGPGPFDFRLPPVERTLKKLIANDGRMPPPPIPAWGAPANGLRCGLSIDPPKFDIGDNIAVQLKFENTTDKPLALHYNAAEAAKNIVINDTNGKALKLDTSTRGRVWRRRTNPFKRVDPGQTFAAEVEGRIVASGGQAPPAGKFTAVYSHVVAEQMLADAIPQIKNAAWLGEINSATFAFEISAAKKLGCIDCHGDSDYHHTHEEDCTKCHVGKVGESDFGTNDDACAECHPRKDLFGRKQILGPGGAFQMASKHLPGDIEDKHCLLCHDQSQHRNGTVNLINPNSAGAKPWTGNPTTFCLTCHDGNPPAGVSFPEEAKGSGFDKMKFMQSALAGNEQGCTLCHDPHGSELPSLLKDLHTR